MQIKIKEIAEGFINNTKNKFGIADPKIEELAKSRYEICLACKTISEDKTICDSDKGGCGCYLDLKTRSSSNCPKNLW